MLRVGVVGAGYFGRFHALKVAAGARSVLVGVCDAVVGRAEVLAGELGCAALGWEDLLGACDAVVIASPAGTHFAAAAAALGAGRHVLVEKPVATTLDEADQLIGLARAGGLVLQVGHLLRYSPERAAIVQRVARPAFIECVRVAPFKERGTDVSVVLDLMVHDLDMVLSLVDAPLVGVEAVGTRVASGHWDMAHARLRFGNGAVAMLVASRVAGRTERTMRVAGAEGVLELDFGARVLRQVRPGGAEVVGDWGAVDLIAAEHAAFAASVLDGAPVLVDGAAGRRALEAALMVEAAIAASWQAAVAGGLLPPA